MPPRRAATTGVDVHFIADDKGVQQMLRRLETGFSSVAMSAFLGTTVGPWLQQRAKQRFQTEGDDVSGKWRGLELSTQDIRRQGPWAVGPAHPINVRTHEMENYVTGSAGDAIPLGPIAQLTFPDRRRGGSPELQKKMKTAQKGAKQKGFKNTPARPVIGLGVQDLTFVVASLQFYAERIGRGGRP